MAKRSLKQAKNYLESNAFADEYLADQLLLPYSLLGNIDYTASMLSKHTTTNIDIIQRFLDVEISTEDLGKQFKIQIRH